ncbi:hypothetical protein FISHEDRAFT_71758 [Fistulina hepatica ATCC 64428]|uniref:SNF2 family DNA-dependent ATPase domain-containing protein n=1 Tax=Fistulina hepatica ATCC 64428 TaxID=1128425 RepID=A0A0D7AII6_9AGAR|nr:hypothetical protein FISHEDRAFT_71758 [Fistulina hepatica ATCC 64428]
MSGHTFSYCKSTHAKCAGPPPCKGSVIAVGALRYGRVAKDVFGVEKVEWRHWGCVDETILRQLAAVRNIEGVQGFADLRPSDQSKISLAIAMKHINPADVPASAKAARVPAPAASQKARQAAFVAAHASSEQSNPQASSSSASAMGQLKRKADSDLNGPALSVSTHRARPLVYQGRRILEEDLENTTVDSEEPKDELLCTMRTNVVGIQYYKGLVGPGEEVILQREPHNPYDSNAIQVLNIGRQQVGHLPKREVATHLASLLDAKLVSVEGIIIDGNLGRGPKKYQIALTLKIYGRSDRRAVLEPRLRWAAPRGLIPTGGAGYGASQASGYASSSQAGGYGAEVGKSGYGLSYGTAAALGYGTNGMSLTSSSASYGSYTSSKTSSSAAPTPEQLEAQRKLGEAMRNAAELREMINGLEKVDDETRRSSLLDKLCANEDVLTLPEYPNPPGIANGGLRVNLMKHQGQCLQWAIEKENPKLPTKINDKPVQFWQVRKAGNQTFYFNVATNTPQKDPPKLGRGALCSDDMGLGKTLTMLALILATKKEPCTEGFSNSTLVVVPLSVLSNWEKQIEDHCEPGALNTCVYYGNNRNMAAAELASYDVVLTTYQMASIVSDKEASGQSKSKKKKVERALFDVKWKRVILDEGHCIRNPKTKMALGVCALQAQRRWVLTGTPIINSPRTTKTFSSVFCSDLFKRLLLRPLKDGLPAGTELLRALMNNICIRRTKDMQDLDGKPLVPLPPVEMILIPVTLYDDTRELYDKVEKLSKIKLESFMQAGSHTSMASNVLSMLTRLRQLVLHPALIPPDYYQQLEAMEANPQDAPVISVTPAEKIRLQGLLAQAIEECQECPVCFDVPQEPRITSCAHVFCLPCITEVLSRPEPRCPMDRRAITIGDLHEPPPATELTQVPVRQFEEDEPTGVRAGSSAKIDQLIELLRLNPPGDKSLVFSQFVSFLDKIAEALDKHGYVGLLSAKRRQETLKRFSVPLSDDVAVHLPDAVPVRRRRTTKINVSDSFVDDDKEDADFVMAEEDDDNDFIDDEDDDSAFKPKAKGRGKGKARKGKARVASIADFDTCNAFDDSVNPKVMLISLKAGALGLNLTVANNVYLMDPWWQEGIESQAIDRVNRIGQKKAVHVYQLIAENTVESKVLAIQDRKKTLVQAAFSGMKHQGTKREQKKARLQDLVDIFGIRRQVVAGILDVP